MMSGVPRLIIKPGSAKDPGIQGVKNGFVEWSSRLFVLLVTGHCEEEDKTADEEIRARFVDGHPGKAMHPFLLVSFEHLGPEDGPHGATAAIPGRSLVFGVERSGFCLGSPRFEFSALQQQATLCLAPQADLLQLPTQPFPWHGPRPNRSRQG